MSVDRSEKPSVALPPTDHVARVLLKDGARDEALSLLRAAVARDPGERACAALLRAVEARPDASVYGPDLRLDLGLVETYTRSGMLLEALAILRGARLDGTEEGRRRLAVLEELLAPCPRGADEELLRTDVELRTGGAAVALTVLEERIARDPDVPEWALRRHALLSDVLLSHAQPAPRSSSVDVSARSPLARALGERFAARDVNGALDAAREMARQHPGEVHYAAVVEALDRLVAAMRKASKDRAAPLLSTQPMTGETVALFQLRMGNVPEAERYFRKLVLEAPLDHLARQRLEDIQAVRQALEDRGVAGEPPAPPPDPLSRTMPGSLRRAEDIVRPAALRWQTTPLEAEPTQRVSEDDLRAKARRTADAAPLSPEATVRVETGPSSHAATAETKVVKHADVAARPPIRETPPEPHTSKVPSSPQLLHKRQRRITGDEGWSAPVARPNPDDWKEDVETDVGSPEQIAELLLAQGYTARALRTYEGLCQAFPGRDDLARRRDQIRELLHRDQEPTTSVELQVPPVDPSVWDDDTTTVGGTPLLMDAAEAGDEVPEDVRVHRIIRVK